MGQYRTPSKSLGKTPPAPVTDDAADAKRGDAWFKEGEYSRAIADYEQGLKLNPDLAVASPGRDRTQAALAAAPRPAPPARAQ